MKKYCALLLALLLLCAAAPLALATQMYDTYGDMDDWDDATWGLSESWSEEQWQDYWQGEEEVYAAERAEELRAKRQALGLPNQDGVNVKLNDGFLSFANVWPYIEEGSVYLPLRDFLAASGIEAQISYDADTGVAQAVLADGRELTACLSESELLAKGADGEEYPIYTYDPPRMINGSFYIQMWALCEFLGWDCSWDQYSEILYIVDAEALIAQIDRDFSIYNRLFKVSGVKLDAEQTYSLSGSVAFNAALYGDVKDDAVQAVLEYDGLIQGLNADISATVKLDFDQIKDTLLSFMDAEEMLLLKAISSGQGRLIVNGAEQAVYLQSNLLPLADKRLGNKDWLKFEHALTAENVAGFSQSIMGELTNKTIGRLIYDSAYGSYYYNSSRDIYANALNQAKLWQALIGDANFKQESRGGYEVYTLQADQTKLKKAIEESDISWPGGNIFGSLFGSYGYYYSDGGDASSLKHTLSFREKNSQITDLQAAAEVKTGGYLPVTYSVTLEYDQSHLQTHFEMKGRYGGKLSLDASYQLMPVKETPAAAPPAGSKIVPQSELNSQRWFW